MNIINTIRFMNINYGIIQIFEGSLIERGLNKSLLLHKGAYWRGGSIESGLNREITVFQMCGVHK